MFSILMADLAYEGISTWDIVSAIAASIAALTAITAIFITIFSRMSDKNAKKRDIVLSRYEKLYSDTFELRKQISDIIGYPWYYEISAVANNPKANELLNNHLNKICNFFLLIDKSKSGKSFWLKLIPPKLFERMYALLPYVLQQRKQQKNDKLFQSYSNMLNACLEVKKFRKKYFAENTVTWIGIRKSDMQYSGKSVTDSISIFGLPDEGVRPNQNVGDSYSKIIDTLYARNTKKSEFYMFYNPKIAYALKDELRENHTLAVNPKDLLLFLNDKFRTKADFSDKGIPCIRSETFYGTDLNYRKFQARLGAESFVVQKAHGGGGYGTYLVNAENEADVLGELGRNMTTYMVSPYYEKSVSVNVHVIVSEKQTVLFPASVQIIEPHENRLLYRGADFIAFRELQEKHKKEVQVLASRITNLLRKQGYHGIAGIDMLICKDGVYFLEVNPRFQASSVLIDRYLSERYSKSCKDTSGIAKNLIELNKNAFSELINTDISFDDEINLACYYYYADRQKKEIIAEKLNLLKKSGIHVDRDGYSLENKINEVSYLFRAIFTKKIAQVSPDGDVWINDNIRLGSKPSNRLQLKIALLNQGVRLNNETLCDYNQGVFEAVDFYVDKFRFAVNSPIQTNWVKLSPYEILKKGDEYFLAYYGEQISTIKIETDQIERSVPARNCLFYATDRIRISPTVGCQYKADGRGCLFCDVGSFRKEYSLEELKSAVDYLFTLLNPIPNHIMIGGGTKNLGDYFTDKKIPVRVRKQIPLIADGNEILAVGGVEICDKIKITENTKKTYYLVCTDYSAAT